MRIKSIDYWNSLRKDNETNSIAVDGDIVCLINGIAFLIQRTNDMNNVVCIRVRKSKINVARTFETFRAFCAAQHIQYIRVEGNTHRYNMLFYVLKLSPKGVNVVKSQSQSEELQRNVFYVKTY